MPLLRPLRRPVSLWARGVAVCAVLAALASVAGCSSDTVHMDEFDVDAATRATCEDFLDALPEKVKGLDEVDVEPDDSLGRAWGNPAIIAICGVEMPPEFDKFSPCEEANGVGWFIPEEQLDGDGPVTMHTIGFAPVVEVRIPAEERPPNDVMVEVGDVVKEQLERTGRCR